MESWFTITQREGAPLTSAPSASATVSCTTCSRTFKNAEGLNSHRKGAKHKKKALLEANPSLILPSCEICSKTFVTAEKLGSHMQTAKHRKNALLRANPPLSLSSCEICSKTFVTAEKLSSHIQTVKHRKNALLKANPSLILPSCEICSKTFVTAEEHSSHMQTAKHKKKALKANPSTLLSCEICSRIFATPGGFHSHMQSKTHKKVVLALTANNSSSTVTNIQTPTLAPDNGSSHPPNAVAASSQSQAYASATSHVIDFGIVDSRSEAAGANPIIFPIASPSPLVLMAVRRIFTISMRAEAGLASSDVRPFHIASRASLVPSSSLDIVITFNKQELREGYYVVQAALDIGTAALYEPATTIKLTMRATVGKLSLLTLLAPTEKYKRPKTRGPDAFRDRVVQLGVRPPMSQATSYRVPLGKNKIPKELNALLDHPIEKQLALLPFSSLALTRDTYGTYFSTLLHAEEHQLNIDIRAFDMYEVALRKTQGGGALVLAVPGLSENRPSVLYGDRVLLMAAGATGNAHAWEGFAHEIRETEVVLHFDSKFMKMWKPESKWNVRFTFSRTALQRMHDAVKRVGFDGAWAQRLFPVRLDNEEPKLEILQRTLRDLRSMNPNIDENAEQRRAVAMALSGVHDTVPLLLFGPPGTGKTSTMIEIIYQLLRHPSQAGKRIRVLATAPSNACADLILKRLAPFFDTTEMFRLNAPSRSFPLDPLLEPYCRFKRPYGRPLFEVPTFNEFESFSLVISTCGAAGILHGIGGTHLGFTHVLVDEAGQALESEVVLALQLLGDNPAGRVVLAGDPYQLGPIVRSPIAIHFGFNVSLLERLVRDADPVLGCYSVARITQDPASFSNLYGVLLRNNYRSHPDILKPPNMLFYHSCLIEAADRAYTFALVNHTALPTKNFPVMFHQVHGKDERERNSPSWFNPLEVTAIMGILEQLLGSGRVQANEIGIIAPYRKQVVKLRTALAGIPGAQGVVVGTTETFQGSEWRVIIVSTVRATKEVVESDKQHSIGFLGDPKRFCVAMTRARAMLCVVGDARMLRDDHYWREWLKFVKAGGGWVGDDVELEMDEEGERVQRGGLFGNGAVGVDGLADAVGVMNIDEDEDEDEYDEDDEDEDEDEEEEQDPLGSSVGSISVASESDREVVLVEESSEGEMVEGEVNSDVDDVVFLALDKEGVVFITNEDSEWPEME